MASGSEEFLRGVLGGETTQGRADAVPAPPPVIPAEARSGQAQVEIDQATAEARNREVERVADGPPIFGGIVGSDAGHGGSGASGPGGYSFSPEVVASKIKEWEEVRDDIQKDRTSLEAAAAVIEAPSEDQPAHKQAEDARNSILAAAEQNEGMGNYCQAYIEALRKANGTYVEHDETVKDAMHGGASGGDALHGQ